MNRTSKTTVGFLLPSIIISFMLLFIALFVHYNRAVTPGEFPVSYLRSGVVVRNALIQSLKLFPPLIIFIYVTSFSIFYTLSPFQTESFTYTAVALPSFITLLCLLLFTVFSEFLLIPKLHKDRERVLYTSRIAGHALSRAAEFHRKNDFDTALQALTIYLELDEKNKRANELYEDIQEKLYSRSAGFKYSPETTVEEPGPTLTYYEKGKAAYEEGKYYDALFYLERALSLHRDNIEIRELYGRSKKKVDTLIGALTEKEEETQYLIQQKEKAINHLENREYYDAYRIFLELNRKYPNLYDLSLYLESVKSELESIDFLPRELEQHSWLPSFDNIIFFDDRGFINTVERIVPWKGEFYFFNIRRSRILDGKTEILQSKYGKLIDNRIRLKNTEDFERISPNNEDQHYIDPPVHPGYLLYITDREKLLNQLTIYERFTLTDHLIKSGADIEDRYVYLSRKLGIFFSLYVLSLLLSGIAWSKRSIYEFPPVFKLLIFLIAVPVLSYLLYLLYVDANNLFIYSHRYATRYLLKNMNVAVYTALINAVIAVFATLFFLSHSSRVE